MKKYKLSFLTFCLFMSLCGEAQNIVRIPQDAATLSSAVNLAKAGDTIMIASGIYNDSVHLNHKDLVFKGAPNGGTVLSPGINGKVFSVFESEIVLMDLVFDDFELNSPPPNYALYAVNSNVKFSRCRFHNLFSPVTLYWGNLEISNSIFSGTRFLGGINQNGGTFMLYNNLIFDLSVTAISINRAHGQFFHNTLIGSTPNQHYGIIINSDSISHFYNNIIDGFGVGIQLAANDSAELAALRIYNNNIHNMSAPYWYEYNESLSSPIYRGAIIANPGTGEISSPSKFKDSGNGDFRLLSNSPCVDAAISSYPFPLNFDLDGKSRLVGLGPDIGAFEYNMTVGLKQEDPPNNSFNFEMYPQPSIDNVRLIFTKPYSGSVEVLDVSGKVLKRIEFKDQESFKIDLPVQNRELFLRLISGEWTETRLILMQK